MGIIQGPDGEVLSIILGATNRIKHGVDEG